MTPPVHEEKLGDFMAGLEKLLNDPDLDGVNEPTTPRTSIAPAPTHRRISLSYQNFTTGDEAVALNKTQGGEEQHGSFAGPAQADNSSEGNMQETAKIRSRRPSFRFQNASFVAHYDQLSYFAVAQNESIGRMRLEFLEKMVQPCGPPPPAKDVEKLLEKSNN